MKKLLREIDAIPLDINLVVALCIGFFIGFLLSLIVTL